MIGIAYGIGLVVGAALVHVFFVLPTRALARGASARADRLEEIRERLVRDAVAIYNLHPETVSAYHAEVQRKQKEAN